MKKDIHPRRLAGQSGARRIYLSVKILWLLRAVARITDPGYGKKPHPTLPRRAFYTRMKKNNGHISRERHAMDYALAAMEQMELYCQAHPGSPAAVRRPRLLVRGELWIALLGPNVEEGIVGIGATVTAALRAFDAQYLAGLRPSAEVIGERRAAPRASLRQRSDRSKTTRIVALKPQRARQESALLQKMETIRCNCC
jgi:hypothetical protein